MGTDFMNSASKLRDEMKKEPLGAAQIRCRWRLDALWRQAEGVEWPQLQLSGPDPNPGPPEGAST